jgi:hypothetical protein
MSTYEDLHIADKATQDRLVAESDLAIVDNKVATFVTTPYADDLANGAQIDKIEGASFQDVSVWGTNLLTNGNFINGMVGWSSVSSSCTILGNAISVLPSAQWGGISFSSRFNTLANHVYYCSAIINSSSTLIKLTLEKMSSPWTILGLKYVTIPNSSEHISFNATASTDLTDVAFRANDGRATGWTAWTFTNVLLIDLTAIFGAGKEPTAAQVDAMLAQYANSWFDGKAKLTNDIITYRPNSPSPDYPAPITNASNFDIVSYGKNLVMDATYVIANHYGIVIYANICRLLPNTQYIFSLVIPTGEQYYANEALFTDSAFTPIGDGTRKSIILTTLPTISVVEFDPSRGWVLFKNATTTPTTGATSQLQVEVGTNMTLYEPYVSNKLTITDELAKLPNGICDTKDYVDKTKHRYTKRIGRVIFDGSTDELWGDLSEYSPKPNTILFRLSTDAKKAGWVVCNQFSYISTLWSEDIEGICSIEQSIDVRINKARLITQDTTGFKSWLASNPITVLYEFITPVETTVDSSLEIQSYKGTTNLLTTANPQVLLSTTFKSRLKNTIEDLYGMPATNLIINGGFANGSAGWIFSKATFAIMNNICTFLASAQNGNISVVNAFNIVNGSKYYFGGYIKADSALVEFQFTDNTTHSTSVYHSGNSSYQLLSEIYTATVDSNICQFIIQDTRTNGWTSIGVQYLKLINLTVIFGVGNEPTKVEMDTIMSKFPNSWFNGTINPLLTHRDLIAYLSKNKANIRQEDWITPTLVGGWTEVSGYPVRYMKDQFGFIHFKGRVNAGVGGTKAFQVPVGYRVLCDGYFICPHGVTNSNTRCLLNVPGELWIGSYTTFVDLTGITYKAEA